MSTQRLVAFPALRGRPLHRLHVTGTLWIDTSEDHANACLRTALWRLKRLDATMIAATSTHLALADTVAVDVRDTAAQARAIRDGGANGGAALHALSEADELTPGHTAGSPTRPRRGSRPSLRSLCARARTASWWRPTSPTAIPARRCASTASSPACSAASWDSSPLRSCAGWSPACRWTYKAALR